MKPTYEQIKLLETVLITEAYIETIRPKIKSIYNEVLDYMIPPKYRTNKRTGEVIDDYNKLYMLDERDSEKAKKYLSEFYAEANKVLAEKGFKPNKEGCCFLLEWESVLRDLKRQFCEACSKTLPERVLQGKTPEQFFELIDNSYKGYEQFLDINTRYVIGFIDTKKLQSSFKH